MADKPWRRVMSGFGEPRHEFLQADGSWKRCGGPRYCRECIKRSAAERDARQARRIRRINEQAMEGRLP